jgi:2-amino-4-hydroxy-6-hydroxymethyldihydropteridine diphosphokinase/dihydropteroate synthase
VLRQSGIRCLISIDTRKSLVAEAAIAAGADVVNDVSAGRFDPLMIPTIAKLGKVMIFMHSRGTPQTMTQAVFCDYTSTKNTAIDSGVIKKEVGIEIKAKRIEKIEEQEDKENFCDYNNGDKEHMVVEMANELQTQLEYADSCGLPRWLQIIDPGVGFAKTSQQNFELLKPTNLLKFKHLLNDRPLMVGASRKRFINQLLTNANQKNTQLLADEVPSLQVLITVLVVLYCVVL